MGSIVRRNGFTLGGGGGGDLWSGYWLLCRFGQWRKRKVGEGERLEDLLLLDNYDHPLEIVWGGMSFAATTTAVDGVLSLNLGMGDIDGCGGGS